MGGRFAFFDDSAVRCINPVFTDWVHACRKVPNGTHAPLRLCSMDLFIVF